MAGYSSTPLSAKLGLKPGYLIYVVHPPDHYVDLLTPLPEDCTFTNRLCKNLDMAHLFISRVSELDRFVRKTIPMLKPEGMIWVSWPKKASGVPSELDENSIRAYALSHRLVDVKVCAVDNTWSGLKLVIPVKYRKAS